MKPQLWWPIKGPRGASSTPTPDPPFVFTPFDVNHILSTGQSLSTGYGGTATSLTQPYANLMLAGGVAASNVFSDPFLPLVEGPTYETISSAMANKLTELAVLDSISPYASLVSVHGAGGTPYSGIKKGTAFYTQGMDQAAGAASRAATNGQTYVVRAVTSVHGESDAAAHSTTYQADMVEWQSDYETDVKVITGQTLPIPMFHSQCSQGAGWELPLAMLAAHVANPGKIVLVCAKYHMELSDGTHMTTAGYRHLGEYYAKAYRKVVLQGGTWEPLRPKTITRVGTTVTIVFYVPAPPIVIDTTLVAAAPGWGFRWSTNGAGTSTEGPDVIAATVTAPDTLELTLASDPGGAGKLRYAYWDQIGFDGPRGNLRDSDATVSRFGFDLSNWCVQFEEEV